jgi:hypothetical protein
MSSATSFNASVESPHKTPLQLPPRHHDSPVPIALSPRTVQTTLQSQPDINATLLQGIANSLLQTIANWEASTSLSNKQYEDRLRSLEQRVLHYEDTFNEPLTGYTPNNGKISNFHIPVGDGLYQEAKWICLNNDGTVSGYHSMQGPYGQPYIIDLYASPDYSVNSPLKTLPPWFRQMLTCPGGDFQILQQAVADTDDWGLAREVGCYCELDDDITVVAIKIKQYQCDLNAIQAWLVSCESRLTLTCASECITTLQNIPRKLKAVRSGWKRGNRMPRGNHIHTAPLEDE